MATAAASPYGYKPDGTPRTKPYPLHMIKDPDARAAKRAELLAEGVQLAPVKDAPKRARAKASTTAAAPADLLTHICKEVKSELAEAEKQLAAAEKQLAEAQAETTARTSALAKLRDAQQALGS